MPEQLQADVPLRSALQADRLPAVLQAAGAQLPSLDAARALGEAAAHVIAARLAGASWGAGHDLGLDPSVLAAARQAASGPGMRMAMQLAGLPRTAYPPDQVREALAVELARIAQDAAQVARDRHHDLDRECVEAAATSHLVPTGELELP